jgi:4-amino-4-deoxy-L-arabinose transferase-like glycosyltransferase
VPSPNPALVSEREATPLPRVALFLLCAAYVLPGLFRRDPWKSADITAFGYILNIARDRTPWLTPTVGGVPADGAVLPYWIGAVFVKLTDGWLDPALAARMPFAMLLAGALALTWYAAYHLARTESAQPLPFAFGGEAAPVDYARAIADGALLALIACLGLLQLGHETTPELAQLAAVTLFLYGMSSSPHRPDAGGIFAAIALVVLAASGAPSIAMLLAGVGIVVALRSSQPGGRRLAATLAVGAAVGAAAATGLGAWANRLEPVSSAAQAVGLVREFAWFAWPAWFLALWTLWRWRRHLLSRHIAVPLGCTAVLTAVWLAMAGEDRALMLALPGLAVLAAFALPTLQRSASAAIDWFSIFFFTIAATAGWLFYVAMQTGTPAKLAANVAKLSPGYANVFSLASLVFALAGTLAWLWLVRWRTGRNRHPLWKSLVLPASGVTLCWLLAMTVLLPPVDNARSYRSMIERIGRLVPPTNCVAAPDMPRAQVVALEYLGGYRVDAVTPLSQTRCDYLLMARTQVKPGRGWEYLGRERRVRKDDDVTDIYRRAGRR